LTTEAGSWLRFGDGKEQHDPTQNDEIPREVEG
jgi:hypothetical protein